jgi:hydrogenase expression/formation protein HypE
MTTLLATSEAESCIVRAHGGGGEMMGRLIGGHILKALGNKTLNDLADGAVLAAPTRRMVMTTDSFVVQPLVFPGGDIGHIAVCGTVNDLAVMGGVPIGLSLGLIVEEGFALGRLDRILGSVGSAAKEAGVEVVTGDTKVIERVSGDGLFINTAGVASLHDDVRLGMELIQPGDAILINGTLGDHGMAVMSVRNGLEFETPVVSDGAPLNGLIQSVMEGGIRVRFMRDATRGGLASVLADVAERRSMSMDIYESRIPRNTATQAAADMLGFDLLSVANEGKVVLFVDPRDADRCLEIMRSQAYGREAAMIGHVATAQPPLVELVTAVGGRRIVQRPYGEELPRIC